MFILSYAEIIFSFIGYHLPPRQGHNTLLLFLLNSSLLNELFFIFKIITNIIMPWDISGYSIH